MSDTPSDPVNLLPVRDAAVLVDRSPSTIRAWLRAGHLSKVREDPEDPGSRVLVSRTELLAHAAQNASPTPPRPSTATPTAPTPHTAADPSALAELRAELRGTVALLEATRAHLAAVEEQKISAEELSRELVAAAEAVADVERTRATEARADLAEAREEAERWRAELGAVRAELEAVRAREGLSWWRRLLPAPTPPAIEA